MRMRLRTSPTPGRLGIALALLVSTVIAAGALAEDAVALRLEAFGAFNAFRPGDVTAMRVQAESRLPEAVECILQWELPNADGDIVAHARPLTLAPGQRASRWLYARLPPGPASSLAGTVFTLRAFEARDGRRLREIGSLRCRIGDASQPSMPVELREGLIGVVGDGRMGLEAFEATFESERIPSMSEVTRLARVAKPQELPDRWEGLSSLESVVWGGSVGPQGVPADRLQALRAWIERGGHLIVSLPEGSDAWGLRAARHGLSDLMPSAGARVVEGIRVRDLLPLLSRSSEIRRGDARVSMTVFDPKALDRGWKPLLWMPRDGDAASRELRGQAMAVQRTLGLGRVTLLGLDVDALHRQALSGRGLPDADAFWNQVLGRRADAPSQAEYREWNDAKPRQLITGDGVQVDAGRPDFIRQELTVGSSGAWRVLLVLGFGVVFFVLAVPLPWFLLLRRGQSRWIWPAFAAVSVAASIAAWIVVATAGGPETTVRHLTVLDAVEDGAASPPVRGVAWISAALSGFGTATVRLGAPGSGDLLLDWAPPGSDPQRFPDTARGERDIDGAGELRIPARSTSTDLQGWWLGAPPPGWGRVIDQDRERPVRATARGGESPRMGLEGVLRHVLPAPLRQVTVIHVGPFTWEGRRWSSRNGGEITPSALPPRPARIATIPEWDGRPLDVGSLLYPSGSVLEATRPVNPGSLDEGSVPTSLAAMYRDPLLNAVNRVTASIDERSLQTDSPFDELRMLTLFQMLTPPEYRRSATQGVTAVRIVRSLGRELDLSAWFTRPCLIVTGFLDDQPLPVAFELDGEKAPSRGRIMVRWVLPLPAEDAGTVAPMAGRAVP